MQILNLVAVLSSAAWCDFRVLKTFQPKCKLQSDFLEDVLGENPNLQSSLGFLPQSVVLFSLLSETAGQEECLWECLPAESRPCQVIYQPSHAGNSGVRQLYLPYSCERFPQLPA